MEWQNPARYGGIFTILDVNFREFLFYEIQCIRLSSRTEALHLGPYSVQCIRPNGDLANVGGWLTLPPT